MFNLSKKKRNCATPRTKTKALSSCAGTAWLICVFVYRRNIRISHNAAHITSADHLGVTLVVCVLIYVLPKTFES